MNRATALLKYSATRLALAPIMLWLISSMVFLLLRVAPGDPVDAVLGNRADALAREVMRAKLGLDQPLFNQYLNFLNGLIHGDLGESLNTQEPVSQIIVKALPASLELGLTAIIVALVIGFGVGFTGIARPEGKTDLAGRLYGIGTYALPPFWAAMLIQLFFCCELGLVSSWWSIPSYLFTPRRHRVLNNRQPSKWKLFSFKRCTYAFISSSRNFRLFTKWYL